jgi:hypothetical protein
MSLIGYQRGNIFRGNGGGDRNVIYKLEVYQGDKIIAQ